MINKTAVIVGATGLIGGHLLNYLLDCKDITKVKLLVRSPMVIHHPKAKVSVVKFMDGEMIGQEIAGCDVVYCAVGTTNKKVKGDKELYRKVDFDIPYLVAKKAKENGTKHFVIVSTVGADSKSKNFYLKLKGEIEDALLNLNLPVLLIFRPSMLLGKRKEYRLVEHYGKMIISTLSFLIPSKYKPIGADEVAKAMIDSTKKNLSGVYIFHFKEIKALAGDITATKNPS